MCCRIMADSSNYLSLTSGPLRCRHRRPQPGQSGQRRLPALSGLLFAIVVVLLTVASRLPVAAGIAVHIEHGLVHTTGPLDCQPDQCANVVCPADSRPLHPDELHPDPPTSSDYSDPDRNDDAEDDAMGEDHDDGVLSTTDSQQPPMAMYIENKSHHHHHLQRHHQPRHIVEPAPAESATASEPIENANATRPDRARRSLRQYKRRITIVPVDHHTLHKRDLLPLANRTELLACCARLQCRCDTVCQHSCADHERPVMARKASQLPGDCCDEIRCEPIERRHGCFSPTLRRHFEHGEDWSESACEQCTCDNGTPKCQSMMCRSLSCKHTVQPEGQCCPQCDHRRSPFCVEHVDCALACKYGFELDAKRGNCQLCQCKRPPTTTTTTTAEPTTISSSSASTSWDPTMIVYVEIDAASPPTTSSSSNAAPEQPDDPYDNVPAAPSPPLAGSDPTDPTVMSIRSYFEEHHLYIIVSAAVFAMATLLAGLSWTYCKFSNKNSYNIVPNA